MKSEEFFREFEHTGDVGIEIAAPTRAELFRRAALGMARLMVEAEGVRPVERRRVEAAADNDGDLMHDLLAELLNLFLVDAFIWCEAAITEGEGALSAELLGERFDPARHTFRGELKAVTYHQLSVENAGGEWRARIIFDI